ncbi:MAG: hypothetical protein B6226_04425 [Candidatus Cloacimonetes bacterium 4572_65]|nr:MAG: hypothetical protein B6226_04425 [Candidatus Cloacimonetes bacterium 4572_65]
MRIEKLHNLAINQSGFIFDPSTGYSYNANETAIDIVEQFIDGKSREEVIVYLMNNYDVTKDDAVSDVEYFVRVLENYNLVGRANVY